MSKRSGHKAGRKADRAARDARKVARLAAKLARSAAGLEREEEERAHAFLSALHREEAEGKDTGEKKAAGALPERDEAAQDGQVGDAPRRGNGKPEEATLSSDLAHEIVRAQLTLASRRHALLIINSKSGPHHDSLTHVRDLVDKLAAVGIQAEVKVKVKKSQARRDARKAAKEGYPLVIAAGGDGTVEAVARGLLNTGTVLGIIPLGTYNNVATSLGIPTDLSEACALIASGPTRAIDVGLVHAKGKKKPRPFLEMSGIGLVAALMPVGQDVEKGRWQTAAHALPVALNMTPTDARITLDGHQPPRVAKTLLVEVHNGPRSGAGMDVAPQARMDDGLLDVQIYEEIDQAALARRFVALKLGLQPEDVRIDRARAVRVDVRTSQALPVVADSKVIGTTPARFEVLPGALLTIPGPGYALARPPSNALITASIEAAAPLVAMDEPAEEPAEEQVVASTETPDHHSALATVANTAGPIAAGAVKLARESRQTAVPAAAAVAGAAAVPLLRLLLRRLTR